MTISKSLVSWLFVKAVNAFLSTWTSVSTVIAYINCSFFDTGKIINLWIGYGNTTPQMQRDIERIITLRQKECIVSPYLFATRSGDRPFRGCDVIRRFAKEANVQNPALFTWTKMRKQLATITQVMEITDTDQDLLAKFLDHDIRVHREVYRLPMGLLQKAKVAKMLLGANRGADMSVELLEQEIGSDSCLNPEEDLEEKDNDAADQNESDVGVSSEEDAANCSSDEDVQEVRQVVPVTASIQRNKSKRPTASGLKLQGDKPRKERASKASWSAEERAAVHQQLQACITMHRVPNKAESQGAIEKEPALFQRTWRSVKFFVYNLIQKHKKKQLD